jgi:hypothetical protein
MAKLRKISIVLLSITCIIGLIRGFRMTQYPDNESLPFPYTPDALNASVFSNYAILGGIIFVLIGVFSLFVIICILYKVKRYAYLIIIEGVFVLFFTLIHILLTSFGVIHLFILPICAAVIILGVLQTPREF